MKGRRGPALNPLFGRHIPDRATTDEAPDETRMRARGEGKADSAERQAKREERGKRRQERMAAFDTDGDGQLSDGERSAMREARIKDMVAKLDSDGDGKVSQDELASGPGRGGRIDFATADTDKDGALSEAELAAAMPQRGKRGGGRFGGRHRGGGENAPN